MESPLKAAGYESAYAPLIGASIEALKVLREHGTTTEEALAAHALQTALAGIERHEQMLVTTFDEMRDALSGGGVRLKVVEMVELGSEEVSA